MKKYCNSSVKFIASFLGTMFIIVVSACAPQPGPDKTIGGAVLGAAWGAGAGAVVGHQVSYAGEGAAVGAGLGAASGAMQGAGYDVIESEQLRLERELANLQARNLANYREIAAIQTKLDRSLNQANFSGIYQVYFDDDATNVRSAAIADLEKTAELIKKSPFGYKVHVVGHADDSGNPTYDSELALARAKSVSSYLAAHGLSLDQMEVKGEAAEKPLANNSQSDGRQLNRRVDVFLTR